MKPAGLQHNDQGISARVHGESGQALVEVAVSAFLLIVLLVGLCECGVLEYDSIVVVSAARAGVQYGAQSRTTASDAAGMRSAAVQDSSNLSGLNATATHFCSCSDGSGSTCAAGDCATSRTIEYVQVNTSATVVPPFHLATLPQTFTLSGQAIMRVGQ